MGASSKASTIETVADVSIGFVEEAFLLYVDRDVAAETGTFHAVFEGGHIIARWISDKWCHVQQRDEFSILGSQMSLGCVC